MLLTTTILDPERKEKAVGAGLQAILPKDYIVFLEQYGEGEYCDEVQIFYPDEQHVPLTFGDHTDLWDFDQSYTAEDLLQSISLGSTANGDIICVSRRSVGKTYILPRHSLTIKSFNTFFDAVHHLLPKASMVYYDPLFDNNYHQISLATASGLLPIDPVHRAFIERFTFDVLVNEATQPKYIIQEIGGWITFDLVYKNSITIKYQNAYAGSAHSIIDFLTSFIHGK